jgi:probable rRNA maturation factor
VTSSSGSPKPLEVRPADPKPQLSMQVQLGDGVNALPVGRQQLRRWAQAALQQDVVLTLRFVSELEGRALNLEFRDQDHATNVLTFQYPGDPVHQNVNNLQNSHRVQNEDQGLISSPAQADVLICLAVVQAEAAEQNKPVHHHLAHLVIHGTLHAQGWDHQSDLEAQEMEALETQLLARFGIPDPYRNLGANS